MRAIAIASSGARFSHSNLGERDNALIIYIYDANGTSAEREPLGTPNGQ